MGKSYRVIYPRGIRRRGEEAVSKHCSDLLSPRDRICVLSMRTLVCVLSMRTLKRFSQWSVPMSLVFGSLDRIRWVILPRARDWIARIKSFSGISVSLRTSYWFNRKWWKLFTSQPVLTMDDFVFQVLKLVRCKNHMKENESIEQPSVSCSKHIYMSTSVFQKN